MLLREEGQHLFGGMHAMLLRHAGPDLGIARGIHRLVAQAVQAILSRLADHVGAAVQRQQVQLLVQCIAEHAAQTEVAQRLVEHHPRDVSNRRQLSRHQVNLAVVEEAFWLALGALASLRCIGSAHGLGHLLVLHAGDHYHVGGILPSGLDGGRGALDVRHPLGLILRARIGVADGLGASGAAERWIVLAPPAGEVFLG